MNRDATTKQLVATMESALDKLESISGLLNKDRNGTQVLDLDIRMLAKVVPKLYTQLGESKIAQMRKESNSSIFVLCYVLQVLEAYATALISEEEAEIVRNAEFDILPTMEALEAAYAEDSLCYRCMRLAFVLQLQGGVVGKQLMLKLVRALVGYKK